MLAFSTQKGRSLSLLTLLLAVSAPVARANGRLATTADLGPYVSSEEQKSVNALLANIHPNGTAAGVVVASPSRTDPNYWFHWTRDAALTMGTVVDLATATSNNNDRAYYFRLLSDYVNLTRKMQQEDTQSGRVSDHFANSGEPKFEVDGVGFQGQWGRPQDDGPALRAITLMRFQAAAYDGDGHAMPGAGSLPGDLPSKLDAAIDADLEFLCYHWRETSFDLWEEVRGHHFYTEVVQRRALVMGAAAADKRGDTNTASAYRSVASDLTNSVNRHWDQGRGYLVETLDRDGGIGYKSSNLDAGIILGALHAQGSDGFYGPSDDRVLATAAKLRDTFQRLYPINGTQKDPAGHALSPGIGRYPEDVYDGGSNQGGNPWALITLGMAELDYKVSRAVQEKGEIRITGLSQKFYGRILPGVSFQAGETIRDNDPRYQRVVQALADDGENYLARVRFHTPADYSLWEQMDRYSGNMRSARDLTWSYASFLTAISARRVVVAD